MSRETTAAPSPAGAFRPRTKNIEVHGGNVVQIRELPTHLVLRFVKRIKELGIKEDMPADGVTEEHVAFYAEVVAAGAVNPGFAAKSDPPGVLSAQDLPLVVLAELTGEIISFATKGLQEVAAVREGFRGPGGEGNAAVVGRGGDDAPDMPPAAATE